MINCETLRVIYCIIINCPVKLIIPRICLWPVARQDNRRFVNMGEDPFLNFHTYLDEKLSSAGLAA